MDSHEKDIATRQVDAIVALTTRIDQLCTIIQLLNGTVTNLLAMTIAERQRDTTPAE